MTEQNAGQKGALHAVVSQPSHGGRRWLVLALIVSTTAIGMMGFAAVFPLINLWVRDLNISHTQAGVLSGLWYLPGFIVALPAGWLFDRFRTQRILQLSWSFIATGTLVMTLAPGFWILCLGRLIFAIGMTAHMVGAPKVVSSWFEDSKRLGFAMGLYAMGAPLGIFASLNALGRIGHDHGWRAAMSLISAVSVVGLLLVFLIPARLQASTPRPARLLADFNPLRLGWAAWLLALGYFSYSIGTEAYLTFTPDYLVRRGYGLAVASAIVGNYAYASFTLKPVFSFFLKRNNAAAFVAIASILAIVSIAILLLSPAPPTVASLVLGISMALGMPALYALPVFLIGQERSGQVYGLFQLFYSFGFVAQPVVGYAIDHGRRASLGHAVIAAYCLLGLLCMLPFLRRNSHLSGSLQQPQT